MRKTCARLFLRVNCVREMLDYLPLPPGLGVFVQRSQGLDLESLQIAVIRTHSFRRLGVSVGQSTQLRDKRELMFRVIDLATE